MPLVSKALADYTAKDLLWLPPITLLIIALILLVLFRNLTCLLLPLLAVTTAQVWTFGLMALLGIRMSMLTMIVPVLLIAVGTSYCLHLCSEYLAVAGRSRSTRDAVYVTFNKLAPPTFLAVITTVIGIGSLALNRIDAIREFSFFACFGMLSLLVLLLTAFPAAMSLFPLPSDPSGRSKNLDRIFANLLNRAVRLNLRYRRSVFWGFGALSLVFIVGVFRIQVETNPLEYFKRNAPVSRHFHNIYTDLSGSFPVNVVMSGNAAGYFEDVDNINELERLKRYLEKRVGVDKVITFADYIKLVNYALNKFDPRFYTLPEEGFELRMAINNFNLILGNDTLTRFMTSDFSRTNVLMLTHLSSSSAFLHMRKNILDKVTSDFSPDLQWDVTGLGVAISASSHHLVGGQIKSLSLTFLLIFTMMALLFFSTKVGLIATLPSVFPILLNFGFMGWFNIHLSVVTSLIACIAIGLGIDDTIHYLFSYNREFKKDLDKDRAMKDTLRNVGRPIISTSITISCGFAILMISHFKPTGLFGLLMVVTMLSALAAVVLMLPTLMLNVELVTAWDLLKWIPALGGIPPGVAHELKQPLNTIKLGSEFLSRAIERKRPIDEGQLRRVVNQISTQINRASDIINRLIEMGQKPVVGSDTVDMNQPVRETLSILRNELYLDNIGLDLQLTDNLPPIAADNQRLAQVFFNLMNNAREAILEKQLTAPKTDNNRIRIRTFATPERVALVVSDTGKGIAPYHRSRIFEPFFTTKAEGAGRGLGLAIANQIIKTYGGRWELESEENVGTRITVSFPIRTESNIYALTA